MRNKIVSCNVWCVDNERSLIEMGMPEGDRWMPIVIDFSIVEAIKLAGESEFIGDDKATVYFNNNYLTLDLTYKEAVQIWMEIKQ